MKDFKLFYYLLENKDKSSNYPFVFLCTYNTKDNSIERPIKYALTEFSKDKKLIDLLSFLDCEKRKNTLIAGLINQDIFYAPCMITLEEANRFIDEAVKYEKDVEVRLPKWKKPEKVQIQPEFEKNKVSLGVTDFNINVFISKQKFSTEQLEEIVENNSFLAMIKNRWVKLDKKQINKTLKVIKNLKESIEKENINDVKEILDAEKEKLKEEDIDLKIDNSFWLIYLENKLKNTKIESEIDLNGLTTKPFDYQITGIKWLTSMYNMKLGGILGDEPGLGKTLMTLGMIQSVTNTYGKQKILVIAPTSLIGNWQLEAAKHTPNLKTYVAHSSYNRSSSKIEIENFNSYDIFIATYNGVQNQKWILQENWDMVILDEAQYIKNPKTKRTLTIKQLKSKFRLAISGTILENNLTDLWSSMDFLNPNLFGSISNFRKFNTEERLPILKQIMKSFILRRKKTNVTNLPNKNIIDVPITMSIKQIALYQNIIDKIKNKEMSVLSSLIKLKQITNHPSQYLGDGVYNITDSGKFIKLLELCKIIKDKSETPIIFTQFTEIIPAIVMLLNQVFDKRGVFIDGSVTPKKRTEIVSSFQKGNYGFLVASSKAVNAGITLTYSNNIIFFDLLWNMSSMEQCMDRVHRISQEKEVFVYRFVTEGTIEEGIINLIESKHELFKSVIPEEQEELIEKEFINLFKDNLMVA